MGEEDGGRRSWISGRRVWNALRMVATWCAASCLWSSGERAGVVAVLVGEGMRRRRSSRTGGTMDEKVHGSRAGGGGEVEER